MDYFRHCPKDPLENLRWRARWQRDCIRDKGLQDAFRQMAFEDVLFWFNAFCWCYEPRSELTVRPFCTWPHQDPAIAAMDRAITDSIRLEMPVDVVVDKSRAQGATWMYLLIFLRRWLRDTLFSAGLVTRTEELVDSSHDTDTLLWKIAWELERLPPWMLPRGFSLAKHRKLSDHSFYNPEKQSTIIGYSAVGDVASGGRKTVFGIDELAKFQDVDSYDVMNSTQHVSNCRFLVSTHKGTSGAYYEAATKASNAVKVILNWYDNPTQNQNLYEVDEDGEITARGEETPGLNGGAKRAAVLPDDVLDAIRAQHEMLRRRGYTLHGKLRSPWYNEQCLRAGATPRGIAQELDRDPRGSVAKVFAKETLDFVRSRSVVPPLLRGRLLYDDSTGDVLEPWIVESESGELKLWRRFDVDGRFPLSNYVIGIDICAGGGGDYTSNSVGCVIDRTTGEQVAEWVSNLPNRVELAYIMSALGKWFHNALLVPEQNFAGGFLTTLMEDIGYTNVYVRETDDSVWGKKTGKPGLWMSNDSFKLKLFDHMASAWAGEQFLPRSAELVDECDEYEHRGDKVVHVGSTTTDDEAAKGKAHGDRVIAAAIAWHAIRTDPSFDIRQKKEGFIQPGSMAFRLQEHDARLRAGGDPWLDEGVDVFGTPVVQKGRDVWW